MLSHRESPEPKSRYCYACKKDTELASLDGHSVGLLHAVCKECGFCEDCDEGNV
jgi:hypothetical protein